MMGHVYGALLVTVLVCGEAACVRNAMECWLQGICASEFRFVPPQ